MNSEQDFSNVLKLEEIVNNDTIQLEIENYLNSKTLPTATVVSRNVSMEEPLEQNVQMRAEGFQEFETRIGVNFDEVNVTSHIEDIVEQNEKNLILKVYEWTDISYSASDAPECVDVMGYGTEHIMTFEMKQDSYELVDDSFDERFITGVCSNDVLEQEELFAIKGDITEEAALSDGTNLARSAVYDVDAALTYANQWCGIPVSDRNYVNGSTTNDSTDYYNTEYTSYRGADCANFVSQCLYAGGLSTDSTWYAGSVAWIRASGLRDYLVNCGYTSVLANSNNIYPGNPVYWINGEDGNASSSSSGHQMICTGYNSSGVAVLNAHSNNAYPTKEHVVNSKVIRTLSEEWPFAKEQEAYIHTISKDVVRYESNINSVADDPYNLYAVRHYKNEPSDYKATIKDENWVECVQYARNELLKDPEKYKYPEAVVAKLNTQNGLADNVVLCDTAESEVIDARAQIYAWYKIQGSDSSINDIIVLTGTCDDKEERLIFAWNCLEEEWFTNYSKNFYVDITSSLKYYTEYFREQ